MVCLWTSPSFVKSEYLQNVVFLFTFDLFSPQPKPQPLEKIENLKTEIHKQRPSLTSLSRFSTGSEAGLDRICTGCAGLTDRD